MLKSLAAAEMLSVWCYFLASDGEYEDFFAVRNISDDCQHLSVLVGEQMGRISLSQ